MRACTHWMCVAGRAVDVGQWAPGMCAWWYHADSVVDVPPGCTVCMHDWAAMLDGMHVRVSLMFAL